MTIFPDSAWSSYEQVAVVISFLIALIVVALAFKSTKLHLRSPFIVSLTWDFSRSWASNISSLAGIIGVAVTNSITTDFKPFTDAVVKNSYTVTCVLMAAVVLAAPSIYTMLQLRKEDQLVGCTGGFLAASVLTIWGTMAQLLLQIALLIAFISEQPNYRYGLIVVTIILSLGLFLLVPYSIKSIQIALAAEVQPPEVPVRGKPAAGILGKLQIEADVGAGSAEAASKIVPRRLPLL